MTGANERDTATAEVLCDATNELLDLLRTEECVCYLDRETGHCPYCSIVAGVRDMVREIAARASSAENALREAGVAAVEGVLDLMSQAGNHPEQVREPGAIRPHSNGYGCWFVPDLTGLEPAEQITGTRALTAEEIIARIDARAALEGTAE